MPSFRHGKTTRILYGEYDLSPYLNEAATSQEIETGETTAYGSEAKTYITGLQDATASTSGMFESSTGGIDAVLSAALQQDTHEPFTVCPFGYVPGSPVRMLAAIPTSYEVSAPVSDVVSVGVEWQADGGVGNGVYVGGGTVSSGNLVGDAVDNGVTTPNGVVHIHVTENGNAGITTVKMQASNDGSTWLDLGGLVITYDPGETGYVRHVRAEANNLPRYTRAVALTTGSGAFTFHVALTR